jgi:hypothetical protein
VGVYVCFSGLHGGAFGFGKHADGELLFLLTILTITVFSVRPRWAGKAWAQWRFTRHPLLSSLPGGIMEKRGRDALSK